MLELYIIPIIWLNSKAMMLIVIISVKLIVFVTNITVKKIVQKSQYQSVILKMYKNNKFKKNIYINAKNRV